MTVREFVHDFSAFYLRSIYLKVVILFGAFLAAATGDWTVAVATAGIPLVAALIAHLSRAPRLEPPAAARWELKVANPVPGQCPVCGLADLDERAVGDELLGDAGTALARVVPYGPDRAHAECAAVVPYAAPLRSTPGAPSQVAAKGSRTARWLAPAVESEGERLLAVLRSHGPDSPRSRPAMRFALTARSSPGVGAFGPSVIIDGLPWPDQPAAQRSPSHDSPVA